MFSRCASGSCILANWQCDGDSDCNDGSDELNCGMILLIYATALRYIHTKIAHRFLEKPRKCRPNGAFDTTYVSFISNFLFVLFYPFSMH